MCEKERETGRQAGRQARREMNGNKEENMHSLPSFLLLAKILSFIRPSVHQPGHPFTHMLYPTPPTDVPATLRRQKTATWCATPTTSAARSQCATRNLTCIPPPRSSLPLWTRRCLLLDLTEAHFSHQSSALVSRFRQQGGEGRGREGRKTVVSFLVLSV